MCCKSLCDMYLGPGVFLFICIPYVLSEFVRGGADTIQKKYLLCLTQLYQTAPYRRTNV